MEKHVYSTSSGIFDMDLSPGEPQEAASPPEDLNKLPEIEILEDEAIGWLFIKNSDDERILATISFAEEWARHMQFRLSGGNTLEEIWAESAGAANKDSISSDMKYLAVRMLSKHWVHRDALRKAFDEYWQDTGDTHLG